VKQTAALLAAGIIDKDTEAELKREVADAVAAAATFADAAKFPNTAEALTDVW
jgi:TPP-dependent pyruvate/acetoin dehydrogenase alpha subunit